jgi:hypothetical protein
MNSLRVSRKNRTVDDMLPLVELYGRVGRYLYGEWKGH